MNVLLIAEESVGIRLVTELSKLAYNIVAVLTTEPPEGSPASSVWNSAKSLGYRTWSAKLVKETGFAERLQRADVDVILNVHSLYIIGPEVLSSAKIGAFNLHPGPLPQYAGLNAPSWAIYNGEAKHAVTLHKMEPGIDTGAIVFEHAFDIGERDTGLSVALRCMQLGIPLILELLKIASKNPDAIPYRVQDLNRRRYYGKQVPQHGRIVWEKPAKHVFDFVRACDYAPFPSPWGKPQTIYRGEQVAVTKSALSGNASQGPPGAIMRGCDGNVYAACSDEWLEIRTISLAGRTIAARNFLETGSRFDEIS